MVCELAAEGTKFHSLRMGTSRDLAALQGCREVIQMLYDTCLMSQGTGEESSRLFRWLVDSFLAKYLLHRLIFVARLQENASEGEITDYHEQLFQKISRFHLGEAASGVLLIYSQSILHILEASSGTIYHILMDLALFEHQGAVALLQDIKILVMSHNIPTRLFSQWNATKVEVPVTLEDVTQSQTTEEVITECLTLILKLGVYLATLKVGNKSLGECLHTAVPELLIPAETIQYLCRSQECLSPTEFLKMYNNPLQPQMDSETVWPTPTHMST